MAERELHYFVRGNTAAGLHNLAESAFQGIRTLYVLEGFPGGTAEVLGKLASDLGREGWELELVHQPLDSDLLEGIIIRDLSVGYVDAAAWGNGLKPEGTDVRSVDLRTALDQEQVTSAEERIQGFEQELAEVYEEAYAKFLETLRIHDEWEKFYIDNLDRERMDRLASEWGDSFLKAEAGGKRAEVTHRFLGAATWRGAVDFVPNLTDRLETRVYVKGRPGSGKSTLFRKLAAIAEERGIDTEVYHCGFDPNSLDMLIFPDLSLAIFDSTAPHEHFPAREGDSILDVYELAITPGTDEKYADSIRRVKERYSASMKESIAFLARAKEIYNRLEGVYHEAAERDILHETSDRLLNELKTADSVEERVQAGRE